MISTIFVASMPSFMSNTGRLLPAEIVGGQLAPSPIPWQVSVQKYNSHFCGATILDNSTLLSAAHCFQGSNSGVSIKAGSVSRTSGGQVSCSAV